MPEINDALLRDALEQTADPRTGKPLSQLAAIGGIHQREGNVQVALEIDPKDAKELEELRQAAEKSIKAVDGVLSVVVMFTAARQAGSTPPPAASARPAAGPAKPGPAQGKDSPFLPQEERALPGVKQMISVASGKGGVGKSTTTVNIALALTRLGYKVGILDADIYGPSIPRMLGLEGQRPDSDGEKISPLSAYGVKTMSIGYMVPADQPVVWRGPMAMNALDQLTRDVNWGELDFLMVDLPPGTGDVQISLAQRAPLTGSVVVSTPQDVALGDARKGLNMFRQVDIEILGLVENMSHFICTNCGTRHEIFSHGGAKKTADEFGVPFLGDVPLNTIIRQHSDDGTPVVMSQPDSPEAEAYLTIARGLVAEVDKRAGDK